MIGFLFRNYLYTTPGELVFTFLFTGTGYELVMRPERVVEEPKDWLLVAAFAVVAVIAIFRSSIFLYNSRYLKGLKFNFYKVQQSLLLASSLFFIAAVVFHLSR